MDRVMDDLLFNARLLEKKEPELLDIETGEMVHLNGHENGVDISKLSFPEEKSIEYYTYNKIYHYAYMGMDIY
jgi:hypothetical protein